MTFEEIMISIAKLAPIITIVVILFYAGTLLERKDG